MKSIGEGGITKKDEDVIEMALSALVSGGLNYRHGLVSLTSPCNSTVFN